MRAKFIKEENIKPEINEAIKISGHVFKQFHINHTYVYVGKEGVLGKDNVFISWELLDKLKQQL